MRAISDIAREEMLHENTSSIPLAFLDLDVSTSIIRVVNNWEDVTRNGNLYLAFHFEIQLPDENSQAEIPEIGLKIDNIDQSILPAIQQLSDPIPVTLAIALHESPDVTEAGPFEFLIKGIEWDETFITASMTFKDIMVRSFPHKRFIPRDFPGAF